MTLYRVAVKGSDSSSDGLRSSRVGQVHDMLPPVMNFGKKGERGYVGILIDIPDGHPILDGLGGEVEKKAWTVDLAAAGLSAESIAKVKNRRVKSPDGRVLKKGNVDRLASKVSPLVCLSRKDETSRAPMTELLGG